MLVGDNTEINASNIIGSCQCLLRANVSDITIINSIKHIFDAFHLSNIAIDLGMNGITRKSNKTTLATAITRLATVLYKFESSPAMLKSLVLIQRRWRHILQGKNLGEPSNEQDPFTLADVKDIPHHLYFAFKDNSGKVWAFNIPDLYYHTITCSATNPYNREPLDESTIQKLNILASRERLHARTFSLDDCTSINQMYTYVLSLYEHEGFYLQNDWFIALNDNELRSILQSFNCTDEYATHRNLIDIMYHVVSTPTHTWFSDVCYLVYTIGQYIPQLKQSLPEWVEGAAFGPGPN